MKEITGKAEPLTNLMVLTPPTSLKSRNFSASSSSTSISSIIVKEQVEEKDMVKPEEMVMGM